MGKEEERIAREFSENIDRMLAGKEVEISDAAGDDYRTALDFTRRLIEMRAAPRPAFRTQLKERLLARVRQAEARQGAFWGTLHNIVYSPVWRAVTATVVVVLVAVGVMWGQGVFTPSGDQGFISQPSVSDKSIATEGAPPAPSAARTPDMTAGVTMAAPETGPAMAAAPPPVTVTATAAPTVTPAPLPTPKPTPPPPAPPVTVTATATPTPVPTPTPSPTPTTPPPASAVPPPAPAPTPAPAVSFPPLDVTASTGKSAYLSGEEVTMEFFFKNTSPSTISIYPFPPQVEIMRARSAEIVRTVPAGTEDRLVSPGEVTGYTVRWDQRDNQGQQVSYGYYVIEMGSFRAQPPTASTDVRMKPAFGMQNPILILPAEGALEKSIAVSQAVVDNNVTITLERVEMSAFGLDVYAFHTPPGYYLPQGPQIPPPAMLLDARAEYSLDGGVAKETGPSAVRFLENGMQFIWRQLDPVPGSAREMVFRVIRLGEQSGVWEFRIPLQ
ncbi:MAG: hypothetical protein HY670_10875 [Chloroflexi bacterium]|nr:hypothetical protein [Chloroflexota bacterium]